jgi:hypothetical protein
MIIKTGLKVKLDSSNEDWYFPLCSSADEAKWATIPNSDYSYDDLVTVLASGLSINMIEETELNEKGTLFSVIAWLDKSVIFVHTPPQGIFIIKWNASSGFTQIFAKNLKKRLSHNNINIKESTININPNPFDNILNKKKVTNCLKFIADEPYIRRIGSGGGNIQKELESLYDELSGIKVKGNIITLKRKRKRKRNKSLIVEIPDSFKNGIVDSSQIDNMKRRKTRDLEGNFKRSWELEIVTGRGNYCVSNLQVEKSQREIVENNFQTRIHAESITNSINTIIKEAKDINKDDPDVDPDVDLNVGRLMQSIFSDCSWRLSIPESSRDSILLGFDLDIDQMIVELFKCSMQPPDTFLEEDNNIHDIFEDCLETIKKKEVPSIKFFLSIVSLLQFTIFYLPFIS